MKKVSPLLFVSLLFVVIGLVSCEDGGGGGGHQAVGQAPAPVPQTGQTSCWDTGGVKIACAGTGQDGDIRAGVEWPDPRFTDNMDGTIRDNLTGLIWLRDANCFGRRTWAQALEDANTLSTGECGLMDGSLGGDWRLPNVLELASLFDFENAGPALPPGHPFINVSTTQDSAYWSSTTLAGFSTTAWGADFVSGGLNLDVKTISQFVLPVRSQAAGEMAPAPVPQTGQTTCWDSAGVQIACAGTGQDGDIRAGVEWPDPRFTEDVNGTITDNLTGLIWLKDANCFGRRTWTQALEDANTLSAGECGLRDGSRPMDWRLPNLHELMSLFDFENFGPALPPGHPFPNIQQGTENTTYWSSTTLAFTPGVSAWRVNFTPGPVSFGGKFGGSSFLTAVRGGS
jgi:hypothetical protein